MPYSDTVGDNAMLLKRTLTSVTDFSARSRRTEVIYYWIATAIISVMIQFPIAVFIRFEIARIVGTVLQLVFLIPLFALFVRRLRDQGRSPWWGMLLPASVLLSVPRIIAELQDDQAEAFMRQASIVGIVAWSCAIAVFILCLIPGTNGTNRYGPDPRLQTFDGHL